MGCGSYLLVDVQLAEDLGSIQQVGVVDDPRGKSAFSNSATNRRVQEGNVLLDVVGYERQVQDQRYPVSVDQEHKGQESMDGSFGDDVGVETVAEVNGVDIVAVEVAMLASNCMRSWDGRFIASARSAACSTA